MKYKEGVATEATLGPVFRVVFLVFAASPIYLMALAIYSPTPRTHFQKIFLIVGFLTAIVLIGFTTFDAFRAYRKGFAHLSAWFAFVQVVLGLIVTTSANLASDTHTELFKPLITLPVLVAAIMGNLVMIGTTWLLALLALAYYSHVAGESPAIIGWQLLIWGLFWLSVSAVVDIVVRSNLKALRKAESLAAIAETASEIWYFSQEIEFLIKGIKNLFDADVVGLFKLTDVENVEPVCIYPHENEHLIDYQALWTTFQTRSQVQFKNTLSLPIATVSNAVYGLFIRWKNPTKFTSLIPSLRAFWDRFSAFSAGEQDSPTLNTIKQILAGSIERSELTQLLEAQALTDPLTALGNRRAFEQTLERELARSARQKTPLSFAMIDLDNFKKFNDTFGHMAGDQLLKNFAKRLTARLRGGDAAFRYGGEEFALIMPYTDLQGAVALLENLRLSVVAGDDFGNVTTFSAGVAQWDFIESAESLIERTDKALYKSKSAGRNKITEDIAIG